YRIDRRDSPEARNFLSFFSYSNLDFVFCQVCTLRSAYGTWEDFGRRTNAPTQMREQGAIELFSREGGIRFSDERTQMCTYQDVPVAAADLVLEAVVHDDRSTTADVVLAAAPRKLNDRRGGRLPAD